MTRCGRRAFLHQNARLAAALLAPVPLLKCARQATPEAPPSKPSLPAVSVVRIQNDKVDRAVEEAIDLLGGMAYLLAGKQRILVKPNMVTGSTHCTTKPAVVAPLVGLMKKAGKEVWLGEGSALHVGYNVLEGLVYRTGSAALLESMQKEVFRTLEYDTLAKTLDVPLLNLNCGELVRVPTPKGRVFDHLMLHRAIHEADLVCSVPMLKTHSLGQVTLGMKNLLGLYPGSSYQTIRSNIHDLAWEKGSPGVAFETMDMVEAVPPGLTVIDGWYGMEGQGPVQGTVVKSDLIIAGTNPLAVDMVATHLMGLDPLGVPTFREAHRRGMEPRSLEGVEVRGLSLVAARLSFTPAIIQSWPEAKTTMGCQLLG